MLSPTELAGLSRWRLRPRRLLSGEYGGRHRSRRTARSAEFADFRQYVAGDDYRQIDWLAFARLERLLLRLYVAEDEAVVNIVLDASASMATGPPPKWPAAQRLAAALALVGLLGSDRVAVGALGPREHSRHVRGSSGRLAIGAWLARLRPRGEAPLERLEQADWLRPGITVVISDFLSEAPDPVEPRRVAAALASRRQEVVFWQVLAPDEAQPPMVGDVALVGPESHLRRELTITPRLRDQYLEALHRGQAALGAAARATGGAYVMSLSSDPLAEMLRAGASAGLLTAGR
jgi:uncharacterized protein (DUF58 family)